jgi:sporulation related protein
MAAYTGQPTRTRRFIRAYLAIWACLAIAALVYLGTLAFQPPHAAAPKLQVTGPDPSQAMRAIANAATELGTLRRNMNAVQQDVSDLKDAAIQHEANDKNVATRLTAVEERLASMDADASASTSKSKPGDKTQRKASDGRPTARVINTQPSDPVTSKADSPPVPLETGSIQPPKEEITFGEPVVTPAQTIFGVQIAAHPSLEGLRERWDRLREAHSGTLTSLEARIVPPRSGGGAYRLLAGPFATRADADRACNALGLSRPACFATPYIGTPL